MKYRRIISSFTALMLLLSLAVGLSSCIRNMDFHQALNHSVSIFERQRTSFENARDRVLEAGSDRGVSVRNVRSVILSGEHVDRQRIMFTLGFSFDFESDWSIQYVPIGASMPNQFTQTSPCKQFYFRTTCPYYDGDMILLRIFKYLGDGWWFVYMDMFGNKHNLDWAVMTTCCTNTQFEPSEPVRLQ